MLPAQILDIWSLACQNAGIRWYLYGESLLCAEGYKAFPDTLKTVQAAVFSGDLDQILEQVIPALPESWQLNTQDFSTRKAPLSFTENDVPVLELHLLSPLEDPGQSPRSLTRLSRIRSRANFRIKLLGLFRSLVGSRFAEKQCSRIRKKACRSVLKLIRGEAADQPYYCSKITQETDAIFTHRQLNTPVRVECGGQWYPVFSDYTAYLSHIYGDYAVGLFDQIGCGLTAGEKEELKQHQRKCSQALSFLQQVSQEFGLEYYLIAGSVLGAVRHGGFIPWDDDIDVGIRVDQLARFEQTVQQQLPLRLPKGFTLEQSGPDNPYPRMFSKICYEGRCCIDLWPLIPTYTDGLKAEFNWYFAKVFTKAHYHKIGAKITRFVRLTKLICLFLTDKQIMALARRNERRFLNADTPAYINIYSIYRREKEIILRRWLDTPATLRFEGMDVPVVGCTEEYLTHLYGNYMDFPPPWKRASRHTARFSHSDNASAQ